MNSGIQAVPLLPLPPVSPHPPFFPPSLLTSQASSDPTYVLNPCYPEGFNITIKASSIYDTECTKRPNDYNPEQNIAMVGAPDSDKCGEIVRSIFDLTNCPSGNCSFNGVEQPPVSGDFMVGHHPKSARSQPNA